MNKILQEFYQYIKTNFKIILDEDYYKPDMTKEEFIFKIKQILKKLNETYD